MQTPAMQAVTSLNLNNIPLELQASPHWLLWKPVLKEASSKISKVPILGQGWPDKLKSYSDIIEQYAKLTREGRHVGLGFAYNMDHLFICVDLDSFSHDNRLLLNSCDSYSEKSPSQKGAHIILKLRSLQEKQTLALMFGAKAFKKKSDRDLFISSGFATITGDTSDYCKELRTVEYNNIRNILETYFSPKLSVLPVEPDDDDDEGTEEDYTNANSSGLKTYSAADVRSMLKKINVRALTDDIFIRLSHPTELAVLDPECTDEAREPWLVICQAVHHNFKGSADGLILLHEWSKTGSKYDKQALISAYESFSNDPRYLNNRKPVTIASLIALIKAQYPAMPDVDGKGKPLATIQNLETYLKFYKYQLRYNMISDEVEATLPRSILETLSFSTSQVDHDTLHRVVASELLKFRITNSGFASLRESLKDYSRLNTYSPIEEYFLALKDEFNPLADPLDDLMGTIIPSGPFDSPSAKAGIKLFIRKWLIQVAAAACTSSSYSSNVFNNLLIFSGPQGVGKTKWVSSIFPEKIKRYCAGSGSLRINQFRSDAVKQTMELQRTLICNINEVDVLFKPNNYSAFKQLLDENTSSVVLPYGRATTTMVRRTVFIGSTNKREFLVDQTGNRRITLIPIRELLHEHSVDVQQLWAHAMHWYKSGEKWWLEKTNPQEREAIALQNKINSISMDIGEEFIVESLDTYFDLSAPVDHYNKLTFRELRDCVPGLDGLKTHSVQFKEALRTFNIWLAQTKHGVALPKTSSGRVQQYYLVPPLKSSTPRVSFKGVALTSEARVTTDEPSMLDPSTDEDAETLL